MCIETQAYCDTQKGICASKGVTPASTGDAARSDTVLSNRARPAIVMNFDNSAMPNRSSKILF